MKPSSKIHFHQAALISIFLFSVGCSPKSPSAENALSSFELEPGFKIEQIASEPLISDPVDMEIDEYGRMYVVEMHGYPLDKSGTGKIKLLSDSNGDGRFDKATVFAEGLVLPNSIMRWKKGVIIADSPNVLYLEDKDGDGKADVRDTLLTGFALSNPQHNLNSPLLGMDNWIYLAHEGAVGTETYKEEFGDRGREIYFPDQPESPRLAVNAGGRSVRFNPDQHKLEMTASHSQFGHSFDAWGHHLQVGNADHIYQEVIEQRYIQRNPALLLSDATQNLSDHGKAAEVFPITQNPQHQLLTDVGVITSACGITVYLGGAFPPPFDRAVFVAEPVNNLVHVDVLKDQNTTFTASRLHPHQEFLASRDAKFRPVNIYTGPDGALYIVDYYRQIIEHPEWMGDEVVKSGTLYNDSDKGRIYRITPTAAPPAGWIKGLSLGDEKDETLVEKLASPNLWWRLNAQRLLIDRNSKGVIPALIHMTNDSSALGRLHALWTLEGMGELQPEQIQTALQDAVPGIRENAIKLAELHLSSDPQLIKTLVKLKDDANPKVRYQLLCTLGSVTSPEAVGARQQILFQDINDRWVQIAALAIPPAETSALLTVVLDNFKAEAPAYVSLVRQLTAMTGSGGNADAIHKLLIKTLGGSSQTSWQAAALQGLAMGLEDRESKPLFSATDEALLIKTFFEHPSADMRKGSLHMLKETGIRNDATAKRAMTKAAAVASDPHQSEDKRIAAIDFIGLRNPAAHRTMLEKFIAPSLPLSLQLAAIRTLSLIPDTTVCSLLLQQWAVLTPELRDAGVRVFLQREPRVIILLDAIEKGIIHSSDVTWPRKVGLMAQRNIPLRDKARALFTKNTDAQVSAAYAKSIALPGDAVKGKEVYQQQCARCHQIRGKMGITLGPDLGTIHNWSKEAILANILAPGQSISSGYDLWSIELKNGEPLQGIIATESPGAITFRNAGSWEKTIRREDIKSLKALTMSIMPIGLETQINVEQMADLLAFLKANK